jgi:hypothetical protein
VLRSYTAFETCEFQATSYCLRPPVDSATFTNYTAGPLANMRPNSATLTAIINNHLDKIHSAHNKIQFSALDYTYDKFQYLDCFSCIITTSKAASKIRHQTQKLATRLSTVIKLTITLIVPFSFHHWRHVSRPIFYANAGPHANELFLNFYLNIGGICSRTVC